MTRARNGAAQSAPERGDKAPEAYLPALARAAANRRRKPRKPLTRSEALTESPWDDDSMPSGWKREFQQAYADALIERGFALESSDGRSGPSGPSGEHNGVQVGLRATSKEQLARWKRAAAREQLPLSVWIRAKLDEAC